MCQSVGDDNLSVGSRLQNVKKCVKIDRFDLRKKLSEQKQLEQKPEVEKNAHKSPILIRAPLVQVVSEVRNRMNKNLK